jgi:hypothetical protein
MFEPFHGNTFVAFVDISGFKKMMKVDRARLALDTFYQNGYGILSNQDEDNCQVEGFFVSDCGILFVRGIEQYGLPAGLQVLLESIDAFNRRMLNPNNYMLTSSIAYGYFEVRNMKEHGRIRKNPIYGDAYLQAVLDNENGIRRIKPGECRIIKGNEINSVLDEVMKSETRLKDIGEYYYFYWMTMNSSIEEFQEDYKNAEDSQYSEILKVLNKHSFKKRKAKL